MNSKRVNVLLTSVANKVSLVRLFQQSQVLLGLEQRVVGVDIEPYVAGLYESDSGFLVPRLSDPHYLPTLERILELEQIKLLVPTRDEDVLFLSHHKPRLEGSGVRVHAPAPFVAEACFDKWRFYELLSEWGLPTIRTSQDLKNFDQFPALIKPKTGKGGQGIRIVANRAELPQDPSKEYIIQELVKGEEYTVDYFADLEARPISVVPRLRYRVEGGESKVGITKDRPSIVQLCKELGRRMGLTGHNTIQCFLLSQGEIKFIEINPRFGGGAPLGVAAGCNSPEFLLRECMGESLVPRENFEKELVMLRHSSDLILPNHRLIAP
jgi:carbamoyl-phosphate synthase large subunit